MILIQLLREQKGMISVMIKLEILKNDYMSALPGDVLKLFYMIGTKDINENFKVLSLNMKKENLALHS